jgi:hypothetical protein
LKHLLLLYLVISKQSCNNLISTLIMSLYASYVCLSIPASSRIPWSILRRWTPHLWGGYVTVGNRARSGLNTHSKHLKIATMFTVRTLSPNKDYSSLFRWQDNLCVHIATTELHQRWNVVVLECWSYFVVDGVILLFVSLIEQLGCVCFCCWWRYFVVCE